MAKNATLHVRLDDKIKEDALEVFDMLGLTMADAITIYLKQVAIQRKIPFALEAPPDDKVGFIKINPIKRSDLNKVIEAIPESLKELWVFGSAVTPFCRPDSDIDICAIGNLSHSEQRSMFMASEGPVDLIVATPEEFIEERKKLGSIYSEVFEKGIKVYERGRGVING